MMTNRARSTLATGLETFVGLVLLTVGFLATLGTVLGFLGSAWWAFDVLSNFRLQYAVALIAVAIVYGLGFGRTAALIFLGAGLVNAALVVPFYIGGPAAQDAAMTRTLELVSFNVGVSNPQRDRILDWVATTNADFVFLLETSVDWDAPIASAGLDYDVVASIPTDRQFGITVLAREEADVEVLRLGESRDQVIRIRTTLGDRPVTLLAIHPRSPTDEDRAAARDELIHETALQADRDPNPVIVIGDLNATPWSHAFRDLERTGRLVDSMKGFGIQPSWPNTWFITAIPIDHMLHSDDLTTLVRSVGPDLGSDHLPLSVTVGLAEG